MSVSMYPKGERAPGTGPEVEVVQVTDRNLSCA